MKPSKVNWIVGTFPCTFTLQHDRNAVHSANEPVFWETWPLQHDWKRHADRTRSSLRRNEGGPLMREMNCASQRFKLVYVLRSMSKLRQQMPCRASSSVIPVTSVCSSKECAHKSDLRTSPHSETGPRTSPSIFWDGHSHVLSKTCARLVELHASNQMLRHSPCIQGNNCTSPDGWGPKYTLDVELVNMSPRNDGADLLNEVLPLPAGDRSVQLGHGLRTSLVQVLRQKGLGNTFLARGLLLGMQLCIT